jgi:acyl carrier protein
MSAPAARAPLTAAQRRFARELAAWIGRRFAPDARVGVHTRVFARGYVSSVQVLELIAWVERRIGRQVDDADIRLDNFRTPAHVARRFAGDVIDA